MKRRAAYLLCGPAVVFLAVFLAGPLVLLGRVSFSEAAPGRGLYRPGSWSADTYRELLADPTFREVAGFTVLAGAGITLLTLLIAYPLAVFIHGLSPRLKRIAIALVLFPKLCNVLVLVYGLQLVLSSAGPVSWLLVVTGVSDGPVLLYRDRTGMVIGEVYLLLPYAVLLILLGLARVSPALTDAARGLGATRWRTFWRVTWPLSRPGLAAAALLTLLWALSAVLGPLLLGGPREMTLGADVQRQALENFRWPRAAATAVALVALLALSAAVLSRSSREERP